MALPAGTTWEVRQATGADTNGGGFVSGGTGTDYSQQDAAQYSGTDLAVDATTNTKVTSAGHNFVAADVDNLINISAGTGWTTGFYRIVSVAANAATLDRSPAAVGTTGGTYAVGGALATLAKALANAIGSNQIYIKDQVPVNITANLTYNPASVTPDGATNPTRITGYQTTRTDGLQARLTWASAATQGIQPSTNGWLVENLNLDGGGVAAYCVYFSGSACRIHNCKGTKATTYQFRCDAGLIDDCEATGANGSGINGSWGVWGCYVHDLSAASAVGINAQAGCTVSNNVIANLTGTGAVGIQTGSQAAQVLNNSLYNIKTDGIEFALAGRQIIKNNVLSTCLAFGIKYTGTGTMPTYDWYNGNAYYNNTSGNRGGCANTTGDTKDRYASSTPALTADPYTSAGTGDFSLNATTNGGASIRAAGFPGVLPSAGFTGYLDMGAIQHADPAGGSGGVSLARVAGML